MCERRLIGYVHATEDIFETTHFPLRIRVLDQGWTAPQNRRAVSKLSTVSVSGFVSTDGQFVSKSMQFQNYPDSSGCSHSLYEELVIRVHVPMHTRYDELADESLYRLGTARVLIDLCRTRLAVHKQSFLNLLK